MSLEVIGATATAVVVVGGAAGAMWLRHGRPRWKAMVRFFVRIDETINGRPATYDAYNHEIAPAIPALADRQEATQSQLGELTVAVRGLVEHKEELEAVKRRVTSIEGDIAELKQARVEHMVTRAEAIAAWRAMEAAAQAEPPPPIEECDTEL